MQKLSQKLNHLNLIVKNALKGKVLAEQNKLLKEQINQISVDGMIGNSSEMSKVKLMIQKSLLIGVNKIYDYIYLSRS